MNNNFILKNLLDRLVMHYITIQNPIEQEIAKMSKKLPEYEKIIEEHRIDDQLKKEQEEQEDLKKKQFEERYKPMFGGSVIARIKQEERPYLGLPDFYESDIYQYKKDELIRNIENLKSIRNTILTYIFLLVNALNIKSEERQYYIDLIQIDRLEFNKSDLKSLFNILLCLYIFNNKNKLNLLESSINVEKNKCKLDGEIKKFEENELRYRMAQDNSNERAWFYLQTYSNSFLKIDESRYEYNLKLSEMFNHINLEELKLYIKSLASVIELTPEEIKQVEDTLGEKLEQNKTFK